MRGLSVWVFRLLAGITLLGAGLAAQTQAPPAARRTASPHGPLQVACESCHTANAWKPIRPRPDFDHNSQTKWPLLGMHQNVACKSCHVDTKFKNVSKECSSCHADIHRRQFGGNCQQCHTVKGWRVAIQQTREHNNRFPLIGAHAAASCESCHKNAAAGQYKGLSTECMACHTPDYNNSVNPPHRASKIPIPCEQCHTMDTWAGAKFDHAALARFALDGGHARLACRDCHANGQWAGTSAQCVNCHIKEFNATQTPNHAQAGFPRECAVCHTTAQWKGGTFDHTAGTKFPLTGAHTQVQCNSCHVGGRFAGTPQACEGCHMDAFNKSTNPGHAASNFPRDCAQCHTTTQWKGAKFDHNLSRFRLTGAHVQVECASCHINGKFTGTTQTCEGCHMGVYTKAVSPDHAAAGFPKDCMLCHTTAAWKGGKFDHDTATKFPLTGAHTSQTCAACHVNGNFTTTPGTCEGCHLAAFNQTKTPNHASAGFSKECTQCHTTTQWKGAQFDHTKTKFPLTGAHAQVQCNACHVSDKFAGTSPACESCHLDTFNKTTNPSHVNAGFQKDCALCHTTTQWKGAKFDHNTATKFALTGAHVNAQCLACHVGEKFAGTGQTCEGCHMADFNKPANNPNHVTAGFPKDCAVCHTTTQWKGAKFDHNTTKFALTGAHVNQQCGQCHVNNVFKGTAATCEGCHLAVFTSAADPNHVAAGFSKDCTACHTTVQWKGAQFDHAKTKFALTGAHANTQCALCHVGGKYAGTVMTCEGCHTPDFTKAVNPNHVTGGFPKDCLLCHTTTAWKGGKFDHSTATKFALTGAHNNAQCAQCHVNGVYKGTAATCEGCHLAEFTKAVSPNHVAAGFSKDCSICHTTTAWKGAVFDHNKTKFALTGAHGKTECTACHVGGKYAGTGMACEGCHMVDFNRPANNPNHVTAGFPRDCAVCHTTVQWKGGKFDHNTGTKFPLTGAHVSQTCLACHVNNVFKGTAATCDGCHLKDYTKTTNPNHGAAGFSKDCVVCHSTTTWKGAKFDHAKTKFPLTGGHSKPECAACHINGKYAGTPLACEGCHMPDFNKVTNPNHVTGGFPRDCAVCHTTVQWKGAKFDHNTTTKFPLTGFHTTVQCSVCHVNNVFKGTVATCEGCHLKDYNKPANNPNHVAAALPKDCALCHTTTTWKGGKFDHNTATKFPLTGFHKTVSCNACHVGNVYKGTAATCEGCHMPDYSKATNNPNHVTAGFPKDCAVCHTTVQWKGAVFNHSTATKFPLTGFHTTVACTACHVNNVFKGTVATCEGCHLKDYTKTTNPNHASAGFSKDCTVCHTTTSWKGATFDHSKTKFPLTGAHSTTLCTACHVNGVYAGTNQTCDGCHLKDYTKTTNNPNHVTAGLPKDCKLCHTTTTWKGAVFNHNTATKFPLTGFHTTVQCSACHVNNVFQGTVATCEGCHLKDYTKTTNPNHTTAGFGKDCALCHTTTTWKGAVFNHNTATKFPLTGFHATVACSACHVNNVYKGTAATCEGCHLKDYNKTTNTPNHVAAGLPKDCALCHTTTTWKGAVFNHNTATKFPLTGFHTTVQCTACHLNNVFKGTVATCEGCHLTDWAKTTNPNHASAGFSKDCLVCHTTTTWKGAKFDHSKTKFALTGGHAKPACAACHINGVYAGTPLNCDGCHLKDYNKTTNNPNHVTAGFPKDCTVCHTTTTWKGAVFNHNTATKFPLTGFHTTVQCAACHVNNVYKGTAAACEGCHLKDYSKTTNNPNHVAAGFPKDCAVCHTTTTWKGAVFNHNTATKFPLTGFHTTVQCAACHVNNVYKGTATACEGCHLKDYNKPANNPNHVAAALPKDCSLCHTTTTWKGAVFNHNTATKFPLTGFHTTVACSACHVNNVYKGTPAACEGCHLKDYNKTTNNPNHVTAGFPKDCAVCHTTTTWKGAAFNHNTATKFPLTGFHTTVPCASCHVNNVFKGTAATCDGCHLKDWTATTNPNHASAGFSKDCTVCHTTTTWKGAKFDHSRTKFPLTGGHAKPACTACHINGVYAGTPLNCDNCHLKDYNGASNPNHVTAGFPKDCTVCHTTTAWKGAVFNHNTATKFPLTGFHTTVQCAACHVNNVYKGTAATCEGCHLKDYNKTTNNPNHVAAAFPKDCALCHTTTTWKGAVFNHNTATKFPLTGFHTTVQCAACHVSNVYKGTATTCDGCHLKDYNKTTNNPNHVAAALPKDCALCHTTTTWKGAVFNHNTATKFPLTGFHTTVQCSACHVNNVYKGTPATCDGCHLKDYNKTTNNPNHIAAGFPKDCTVCHTTTTWKGAVFNHNTATKFPLTGFHTTVACAACHVNSIFKGTPATCDGCHLKDYNKTTNNPNHVAAAFPRDCTLCHTTTQWKGAVFNHNTATKFPLTGFHTTVPCASCHVNNVYKGTAATCEGCHLKDYNKTTNTPNHVAAALPKDCTLCHTTTTWKGAKFDHTANTKFPLTGYHVTVACSACHVNNIYKGTPATCDSCHLKDYNGTTTPNHATAGFPKDCAVCHTTTQWKGAVFNHTTATKFPLTGFHTTVPCASCHVNNVYKGTATTCDGCHLKNYNATTKPNHVAAAFPKDCSLCHTTTQWLGAKFNHTTSTKFPLTGFHTTVACGACHINNVYKGTPATCDGCHLKNYTAATNPNHVTAGFPKDCAICHTTTQWKGAVFNHNTTKFPLTGKHTTVNCALCHVGGRYTGTPTDCYACHRTVYESVSNPNHITAKLPTTCASCHTTTAWTGARLTTHKFPIYTGKHAGKWTTCNDCHTTPTSYAVFSCINCHEHNKTSMDKEHNGRKGYVYASPSCYQCHPQGKS
ncbi:MAG: hypothetical protein IPP47_16260 [Bryobacterales bacterium]|nr:hypothetical protein [Bryobacterales bacterium]